MSQDEIVPQEIQDCISKGYCTYYLTGSEFTIQPWHECKTCNTYACANCAKKCHGGHKLTPVKTSSFYCDCGESKSCGFRTLFHLKDSDVEKLIAKFPKTLYVVARFPSKTPEMMLNIYNALFNLSKKESNVIFALVENSKDEDKPCFEFFKNKKEFGYKEVTSEDLKLSEYDLLKDLDLYFSANYYAHKNPPPEGFEEMLNTEDDSEDEESDESDESEEEDKSQDVDESKNVIKRDTTKPKSSFVELGQKEEEESEDEDYEDDDVGDEEDWVTESEEESDEDEETRPQNSATISKEILMPFWKSVYSQVENNTLLFTTFRNSCTQFVHHVLFKDNPLMKKLGDLQDPPAPDHRELLEFVEEAQEIHKNYQSTKEEVSITTQVIQQKLDKKKDTEWNDDMDYIYHEKDDLNNPKNEWKLFGADLLRIQIGKWSFGRLYKGQFRYKIDPINKVMIIMMFPHDLKLNKDEIKTKEDCINVLKNGLEDFKASACFKIVVSLESLTGLHYAPSTTDKQLALLVFDLKAPEFYTKKSVLDKTWIKLEEDFTEDRQASQNWRWYIVGFGEELAFMNEMASQSSKNYNSLLQNYSMKEIKDSRPVKDEKIEKFESPFPSNFEEQAECCMQ